ncbi:nuclear transport factor 2 family protein [Spirillospora sp. NPDC048819]|uniref:nuclear transport factor 2 family protein n=1 Tax=Spirillospora sp. NPDC048819 TaxID=3155268 RepID=UPI0033DAA61B
MRFESSELVARHMAIWNEPDASLRRRGVVAIYAPDAVLACHPLDPVCGHAAIVERMAGLRGPSGPVAAERRSLYTADGRYDIIRLDWVTTRGAPAGTAVAGHGVLVLDADGRIKVEYRSFDRGRGPSGRDPGDGENGGPV